MKKLTLMQLRLIVVTVTTHKNSYIPFTDFENCSMIDLQVEKNLSIKQLRGNMFMRKATIDYDGIGIVNNRGNSNYWGVSTDSYYDHKFRVVVNLNDRIYTFLLSREFTEKDAAHIAKHLYKYRLKHINLPTRIYIQARKFKNLVYIVDFINQKIEAFSNSFGLYDDSLEEFYWEELCGDVSVVKPTPVAMSKQNSFLKDLTDMADPFDLPASDKELIREFVSNVMSDKMSIKGRQVLNTFAKVLTE